MALSGNFKTTGYSDNGYPDHAVFTWKVTNTLAERIATGIAKITWSLVGQGGSNSSRFTNLRSREISIQGKVVGSGTSLVQMKNGYVIFSGNIDVPYDSTGKANFTASTKLALYTTSYNSTGSGTWVIDAIPRQANITSAPNFNDENNPTIGYSNPAGNAVASLDASIYLADPSTVVAPYRAVEKTESTYTFTLTEAERKVLRQYAKENTVKVVYHLRTVIGSTTYYSSKEVTATIINANPVVSSFLYEDTNSTTVALTGSKVKIIKGKSNVRLHTFSASATKESTLTRLIIENVASTYADNFEKTLNAYAKNLVEVKAVDSRGNTSNAFTKAFDLFVDYFSIVQKGSETLRGDNGVGEGVTLKLNGDWFNSTFGVVDNTLTASYRYRKKGGSWLNGITSLILIENRNTFSIDQSIRGDTVSGFNIENQYEIEVTIADKLSSSVFMVGLISGAPSIDIYKNNIALGGQYDESRNDQPIQLNKPTFDKNGIEIFGLGGTLIKIE